MRHLRIGTRGSVLAKWQAEFVRKQLFARAGVETEIVIIKTSGDKLQTSSLSRIGGKGIFIKELEEALLEEAIDLAVHSVKDARLPGWRERSDGRESAAGRASGDWKSSPTGAASAYSA